MPSLLALVPEPTSAKAPHNDNHLRIPQLFIDAHWQVTTLCHECLHMIDAGLYAGDNALKDFDLIWHLGLGNQVTFMDRMQMLATHSPGNFVNQPDALQNLHSKIAFQEYGPQTYVFNNYAQVASIVEKPGKWVIKPTAASFSDNVFFIESPAREIEQRIHQATANGQRYCLLQKFIEQAENGETRCLLAGERLIGCYRRVAQSGQALDVHSLDKGAKAQSWTLTPGEAALARKIGQQLNSRGIAFAAIDLVEPYLIEVNVANPGGLATLDSLGDSRAADALVESIAEYCLPTAQ